MKKMLTLVVLALMVCLFAATALSEAAPETSPEAITCPYGLNGVCTPEDCPYAQDGVQCPIGQRLRDGSCGNCPALNDAQPQSGGQMRQGAAQGRQGMGRGANQGRGRR